LPASSPVLTPPPLASESPVTFSIASVPIVTPATAALAASPQAALLRDHHPSSVEGVHPTQTPPPVVAPTPAAAPAPHPVDPYREAI
jgi:hypothetical protein